MPLPPLVAVSTATEMEFWLAEADVPATNPSDGSALLSDAASNVAVVDDELVNDCPEPHRWT